MKNRWVWLIPGLVAFSVIGAVAIDQQLETHAATSPIVNCQGCKWNSEWTLWVNPYDYHPLRTWMHCVPPSRRGFLDRRRRLPLWRGANCGAERVTTTTTTTSLPPPEPVNWPCEDFAACGHPDWHRCGEAVGCGGRCVDREGWDCRWDCKRMDRW